MEPLEKMAKAVETMHHGFLFGDDYVSCLDPLAEQEFLAGLAYLKLAQAALMRAHYHQARALAASPYRP